MHLEDAETVTGAVASLVSDSMSDDGAPTGSAFDPVSTFGASDCDCDSHLVGAADLEPLVTAVKQAHERVARVTRE